MNEKQKLGQEPAFANGSKNIINEDIPNGMSKRFYAACAAMQGILAGGCNYTYNFQKLLENSYKLADELLKQENL